jgi:ribosomal protein L19
VLYSPLIKEIKILQKAFIHEGKKKVRRNKLYYILDRDPKEYTIP